MKTYTARLEYHGLDLLLTDWEDGTYEIATRRDGSSTWGPPVTLAAQSSGVSS